MRVVRSLLERFRGILIELRAVKEFVSRIARYPIELGVVRRMLGEI